MSNEENERSEQPQRPPADEPIVAKLAGQVAGPDESDTLANPEFATAIDGDALGRTRQRIESAEPNDLTELAAILQPANQADVRVGSPFRFEASPIAGTKIQRPLAKPEAFYDVGPLRYTAMGAVAAAVLVLGFAAAAAWWFPGGGTIIAALGCATIRVWALFAQETRGQHLPADEPAVVRDQLQPSDRRLNF